MIILPNIFLLGSTYFSNTIACGIRLLMNGCTFNLPETNINKRFI